MTIPDLKLELCVFQADGGLRGQRDGDLFDDFEAEAFQCRDVHRRVAEEADAADA